MKKFVLFLLMLLTGVFVVSAKTVTQPRVTKSFFKIRNESSSNIVFYQQNSYRVHVTLPEEEQSRLVCETTPDGVLVIRRADKTKGFTVPPKIEIYAPRIDLYECTSSGNFHIVGPVEFFDFKVHLTGSGDVKMDTIHCKNLSLITEHGGDIKITKAVVRSNEEYITHGRGKILVNGHKQPAKKEKKMVIQPLEKYQE